VEETLNVGRLIDPPWNQKLPILVNPETNDLHRRYMWRNLRDESDRRPDSISGSQAFTLQKACVPIIPTAEELSPLFTSCTSSDESVKDARAIPPSFVIRRDVCAIFSSYAATVSVGWTTLTRSNVTNEPIPQRLWSGLPGQLTKWKKYDIEEVRDFVRMEKSCKWCEPLNINLRDGTQIYSLSEGGPWIVPWGKT